ncbi:hypothetical protein [Methyloceanibacter caenitepidi]|uniref:Uncharacterized protein n=1 Tax=Methyloceanibacter caenitepidi TaxID=1384459 RepID=A0A0A8K233_9HYPH|nr:hypothetical protein [Methyloceanibacter caenitepidi]BAQ16960.1 hypothetical protein GL4_1504 [Methyloceanibacter caenitepidi]
MRLSISGDTLSSIGKVTDAYTLMCGEGVNAGWLRLAKSDAGLFVPSAMRGSACFNLGETAFAPDGAQKRTECEFRSDPDDEKALLIRLPRWCFVEREEDSEAA